MIATDEDVLRTMAHLESFDAALVSAYCGAGISDVERIIDSVGDLLRVTGKRRRDRRRCWRIQDHAAFARAIDSSAGEPGAPSQSDQTDQTDGAATDGATTGMLRLVEVQAAVLADVTRRLTTSPAEERPIVAAIAAAHLQQALGALVSTGLAAGALEAAPVPAGRPASTVPLPAELAPARVIEMAGRRAPGVPDLRGGIELDEQHSVTHEFA